MTLGKRKADELLPSLRSFVGVPFTAAEPAAPVPAAPTAAAPTPAAAPEKTPA